MKNWEALKALSEGKCVRHESWRKYGRDRDTPLSIQLLSLNDGWEEIPDEQGHDWAWACEQMLAGKKVRRKLWIAGHWYQLQLGQWDGCYRELYEPGPGHSRDCAGLYVICDRRATVSEADFKATDWVLADKGVKP